MPTSFIPLPLPRLRTGANGVDPEERRRSVRPRLLRHIVLEALLSRHPEVSDRQKVPGIGFVKEGNEYFAILYNMTVRKNSTFNESENSLNCNTTEHK